MWYDRRLVASQLAFDRPAWENPAWENDTAAWDRGEEIGVMQEWRVAEASEEEVARSRIDTARG
jgi:hypothetical protein